MSHVYLTIVEYIVNKMYDHNMLLLVLQKDHYKLNILNSHQLTVHQYIQIPS